MKVGIIGLGKMGEAIAYRAIHAGHEVVGFDVNEDVCAAAQKIGVQIAQSIECVAQEVRVFWLMVPHGALVDKVIAQLRPYLRERDIIIDGGNSKFTDSMRRAQECSAYGVFFLDCGTSGGVHGREEGFCLMVGGDDEAYESVQPLMRAIATHDGVAHIGPSGAGHYVKMVHNGIEYALLQAYAEGFHLIKAGAFKKERLDLESIARLWNHGSVIRSWILGLVDDIMREDQDLDDISGQVAATGMGEWTVEQAHESGVPVLVIEESLNIRAWSQKTGGNYATKVVAMLRNKFGGHAVIKK